MAFHHRHGISQHLGNVLDQRTFPDVPHGACIAQLVRMGRAHSEVGLHFGDLGAFEQFLKLYAPKGFVGLQLKVGTTEWLAIWQLVQQGDYTSRKDNDCTFAGLPAFVIEGAVDDRLGVKESRIDQRHTGPT